jgi:hypothetical protein
MSFIQLALINLMFRFLVLVALVITLYTQTIWMLISMIVFMALGAHFVPSKNVLGF